MIRNAQHGDYPFTVYYAYKQAESEQDGIASTGWETMLEGLIRTGFQITGTWPVRSEQHHRMIAVGGGGTNALASSIVLACRPRPDDAPVTTRRDFMRKLSEELPEALRKLKEGNIAPVDFAQAAIGPGMAVFSRFNKVMESSGEKMRVRDALVLINDMLDEYLSEQEGEFDNDTRWALAWFEQNKYNLGKYGEAEVLSKGKNVSVKGLVASGILESGRGQVRLLERSEYDYENWEAAKDKRLNAWELTQRLIWVLEMLENGGEERAAKILQAVGGLGDMARHLAYRLYVLCDRKKWSKEALAYNSLVTAWPEILKQKKEVWGAGYQPSLELGED